MKQHPFVLSPLLVAILIASLALPPQSALALRAESARQAGGLEELAAQLSAPFKAPGKSGGLEEKKPGGWFKHNPVRLAGKLLQALVDESRAGTFHYKTENSHGPLILNAEQGSRLMGGHPVPVHIRHDMKQKKYFDATLTGRVLWIVEDAFSNSLEREIPASTRKQLMELANTLKRERKFHGIQVRQARVISGRWTKERVVKALRAAKRAGLSFEPYKVLGEEQSTTPKGKELKGAYKAVVQSGINQEEWHKSWAAALQSQKIPVPVNAWTGQPLRTASRTATLAIYADPKLDKKGVPASSAKPIKTGKIARLDNIWGLREVKKAEEVVVAGLPLKKRGSRTVFTVQTDDPDEVHFTTLSASEVLSGEVSAAVWINAQGNYHTVQRAVRMDTGELIYPPSDFILIYLDPPLLKNGLVDQQAATLYAAVGQISLELFDHPAVREATTVYAVGVSAIRIGKNNRWLFSVNNEKFSITPVRKNGKRRARLQVQLDSSVGDPLEALLIPSDPQKAKTVRKLYPREDATRLLVYPQPVLTTDGEIEDLGKPLPEAFDPGQIQAIWKDGRLKGSDWVVISGVPMYKNSNGNWVFHSADKEYETGWQPTANEQTPPSLNLAFRMRDPNKRPQWARRKAGGALLYPHAGQKQFFLDDPLTNGQISPDAILFEARSDLTKQFLEHPAVAGASQLAAMHYRTRTRNRGTSAMVQDPFSKKWITVGLPPKTEGSPYQLSVLFERQLPGRPFRLVRVHEMVTGLTVYPRSSRRRSFAPVETMAALEVVRNNNTPVRTLAHPLRQVIDTGHFGELGWDHNDVEDFLIQLNDETPDGQRIHLMVLSQLIGEARDANLPPERILRWGLDNFVPSAGLEEEISLKRGDTLVLQEIFQDGPVGNEIRVTYTGPERNDRIGLNISFPKFRMVLNGLILQGKSNGGEDWVSYLDQEWRKQERAAKETIAKTRTVTVQLGEPSRGGEIRRQTMAGIYPFMELKRKLRDISLSQEGLSRLLNGAPLRIMVRKLPDTNDDAVILSVRDQAVDRTDRPIEYRSSIVRASAGLEEAEDLAPSQVEERLREVMDGYEQVTVLLSGFPPSLLKKHSLDFALPVLGPNAILYRLQPLLQELGPSARLVLEVDGGGAFTLAARFLPVQRSYPGNRFPRAIGSRLRRIAIAVLKDEAAFSTAFQEFLGPGSERKFFERENPASPIDLKETEVRVLLGMAENGEPTNRQKMLLSISPSLLNVVALSVEEADKDKDRREVSPAPLNAQQVLETLERHPELRVETQIRVGPDQEPLTLNYQRIRRDEKFETMIGSFMDNALRLAGLSQAGLEEVKKLSLEQFRERYPSVLAGQPVVRERLVHFTETGADTVRVIQLNRPLTAHVHGKTLLQDVERQRWPARLLRFVPWTLQGVEAEQWGFILRNEDVLGELLLNPKGLFVKPVSPGHLPSAEQLVAEFYWNELKIPMPELLLGQMIFSDGRKTYLVLFSA